jgi:precorrin-6B methylase 2
VAGLDPFDMVKKRGNLNTAIIAQRIYSYCIERYLGVQTTGYAAAPGKWGVHYTPIPYQVIHRILKRLSLVSEDVFVDIGCGKGRAVCCACRWPVRKVVAIEANEVLLRAARANADKVRGRKAPVEAMVVPAEAYDYDDATVVYLYNPFGPPIMDRVFERIGKSLERNPRCIRIAYANCVHEQSLQRLGWLVKREEWSAREFPGFGGPISFWDSRP